MANPSVHLEYPKFQAFHPVTQEPLSGGKLYTYAPGTLTDKAAYTNYARTVEATNPIILDSNGECDVFLDGTYDLVLRDEDDVLIWTVPNYNERAELAAPAGTGTAPDAEGTILNPSFEYDEDADNDPDNWTIVRVNDIDIVSDASTHGKYSLKFTSPGGAPGVSGAGTATSDKFTAKGGVTYNLLFDLVSSVADVHNVIKVNEYNAALGSVASTTVYNDSTTNPTSFTTFLVEITLAATTRYVEIVADLCNLDDPTAGTAHIDNFRWEPQVQGSLLFNGTAGIDAVSGTNSSSFYANDIEVSNGTVDGIFFVDTPNTAVTLANLTGSTYDLVLDNTGGTGDLILQTAGGTVTLATGGGVTFSGAVVGTTANFSSTLDATNTLTLTSTDAGAGIAPTISIYRNSASPTAGDNLGEVVFHGKDSAGNKQEFARIQSRIDDTTSTSEDGALLFYTTIGGSTGLRFELGAGARVGAPTGGDKGAGSLNAETLYQMDKPVIHGGSNSLAETLVLSSANINLSAVDLLRSNVNFTTPSAVSGYAAGHVVYLASDAPNSTTSFDAFAVIGTSFESVGKTGSGATNIWTALNDVPATAVSVILKVVSTIDTSAAIGSLLLYARKGGSAAAEDDGTLVHANHSNQGTLAAVKDVSMVYVPISSSVIFDLSLEHTNGVSAVLYLVGWSDKLFA